MGKSITQWTLYKEEAAETSDDDEELYREAVTIVIENGKASTSLF